LTGSRIRQGFEESRQLSSFCPIHSTKLEIPMPYFILNSKRVFFIHVPKTAGSTILNYLAGLGAEKFNEPFFMDGREIHPRHQPREVLEEIFDPAMFDLVFMVVRHPVARLSLNTATIPLGEKQILKPRQNRLDCYAILRVVGRPTRQKKF
jgi:hypothetical protein